jgi:dipeptidyl aminopeptidase/acylaminoacyl peptidase
MSPMTRRLPRWPSAAGLFTVVTLALPVAAAAQHRPLDLSDLGREIGLSDPRISPDGRHAVVVRTRTDYAENRFERTLVLVDIATGSTRELTAERRAVSSPAWSPAGDRIAFLDVEAGKPAQLHILPVGGGEARRITGAKPGIAAFAWRRDGAALALLREDEPEERTGEERHNRSFEVGEHVYLAQAASLPVQPWLVSAEGGEPTRLRSGPGSVTDLAWTADGRLALLVRARPHTGIRERKLVTLDPATGREQVVLDAYLGWGGTLLSRDGRFAAIGQSPGPELGFRSAGVAVLPLEGGSARLVTSGLDRSLTAAAWLPGDGALLVRGPDHTRSAVWVQPLDRPARRLDLGEIDIVSGLDVSAGGAVVFVGVTPHRPPELYHMTSVDETPRRLTDFNAELAGRDLGRVQTISWKNDGFDQSGVLVYPPGFQAGRRYPLVLSIHGGPMATSTEGWSAFAQLLAAQGWLVLQPNYRGSNNQGDAFQSAVINDAGAGPGRDVMAGVAAVKTMGIVDEDRVAVSGWSYGGFMTAWLTAHYAGWRAAVAGAAVTDWFDWYSLADMNTWAGLGLGGSPWLNDNALNYWRQSPMAYAHQIRTPTLILSTTGDPRVTVTQSYKLYHALRDNGVEVTFIAYPTGGHFPPDPVHQRDLRRRWIDWIRERFDAPLTSAGMR